MYKDLIFIGYSGHAYVCVENAFLNNYAIAGYCEVDEKEINPFHLTYLGNEMDYLSPLKKEGLFVAIGDNILRKKIIDDFPHNFFVNLIHPKAIISDYAIVKRYANILINAGVVVNPFVTIEKGVILNTSCVVEHECVINEYAHIAPGAVLAGNVKIGKRTFIGANAVIKQEVVVGNDVVIGAGSVVINDVPDGVTIVGNPAKRMEKKSKVYL